MFFVRLFFIGILFLDVGMLYAQSGTFHFNSDVTADGVTVTQTISGVTLVVSDAAGDVHSNSLSEACASGNMAQSPTANSKMTLTFSGATPVNITTICCLEWDYMDADWKFTPNVGSAVVANVPSAGTSVTVNFIGITSIEITLNAGGNAKYVIDNVVMDETLPVELTSFSASPCEDEVVLNWVTATEVNNYGFEVQRNTPLNPLSRGDAEAGGGVGGAWETLAFVEGHGNSNSPQNYTYVDCDLPGALTLMYRLKQVDFDGAFEYFDVITVNLDKPDAVELHQNYPNPFNPSTKIKFSLEKEMNVKIRIYNMLGEEVAGIVNETKPAGNHFIYWNGLNNYGVPASSGVYIYRLITDDVTLSKKMLLMR